MFPYETNCEKENYFKKQASITHVGKELGKNLRKKCAFHYKNNNSIKNNLVAYIWEKNFGDNLSTLCAQCMYQFIQKIILKLSQCLSF